MAVNNVCGFIDKTGVCSGCGVCAGICPDNALSMQWNEYGEYIPMERSGSCTDCSACLDACPFINNQETETTLAETVFERRNNVKYDPVVGFYCSLFAGYSHKHRAQASSGGLTTWFLEKLFEQKKIDAVCCVRGNEDPNKLFTAYIAHSCEELKLSSRSAYYPVEFSSCLKEILRTNARYAFVGLPCVIKGVRLAIKQNPLLAERIFVLIGLTCGQQKSRSFAEYICALAGGNPANLKKASFRIKDTRRHNLDHRFEFECEPEHGGVCVDGHIYQSEGMSKLWGQDCFKLKACNFCDDIMAETADMTFGDAIAQPYCYGVGGANFVVVRDDKFCKVLNAGVETGEIELCKAELSAVVERQKGVVLLKRHDLAHRLFLLQRESVKDHFIHKRIAARKRNNFFANQYMQMRDSMRKVSREVYVRYRNDKNVVTYLKKALFRVRCRYPVLFIIKILFILRKKLFNWRNSEGQYFNIP